MRSHTPEEKLPLHWTKEQLVDFRRRARKAFSIIFLPNWMYSSSIEGHLHILSPLTA